jgi:hypothetical protein
MLLSLCLCMLFEKLGTKLNTRTIYQRTHSVQSTHNDAAPIFHSLRFGSKRNLVLRQSIRFFAVIFRKLSDKIMP